MGRTIITEKDIIPGGITYAQISEAQPNPSQMPEAQPESRVASGTRKDRGEWKKVGCTTKS